MARLTQKTLDEGLDALAARDRDVARAVSDAGRPKLRKRRPGFEALLRAIVGQQVSIASATAIWGRLEKAARPAASNEPVRPEDLLALDDAALRGAGLSRQKMAYGRGLAEAVVARRLDLDSLRRMDDEDAVAELVKVKGIGRWTAEIYLLFALSRPDVLPADDLALMISAQRMKRLDERPNRAAMMELAESWRPWRGAAAHLLWHYYRHGADQAATRS